MAEVTIRIHSQYDGGIVRIARFPVDAGYGWTEARALTLALRWAESGENHPLWERTEIDAPSRSITHTRRTR